MKLTGFLIVTCCSIIAARPETEDQELLKRASKQLERLTPYRRRNADRDLALDLANLLETWGPPLGQDDGGGSNGGTSEVDQADQGVVPAWEIVGIPLGRTEADEAAAKRADDEKRLTIDIVADPEYTAMMQERIKRGFNAGSASLITSIAGGVLSGIASASSGSAAKASSSSSSSSSQQDYKPAYGPPPPVYSYEEKPFGAWDFKKTIFSTVFQALKAIGGGVLALKGQLVKGGGYLLAAKSKVISKTGDVITSFGKQLTSSVATYPASYPPDTYTYEQHPPVQDIEHDPNYQGPPPSPDGYSEANDYPPHSAYSVPSDDNNQGGLLIVTPTKSDPDDHHQDANLAEVKPDLAKLEESFGGPTSGSAIKDFLISTVHSAHGSAGGGNGGGSITTTNHQAASIDYDNNINVNSHANPPIAHPAPIYGAPEHYYTSHHDQPTQSYDNYPVVDHGNIHHDHQSELAAALIPSSHHFPKLADPPHLSIQQSVEYPPLHVQQFGSPLFEPVSKLPLFEHDDGMSVHASLTVDTEPKLMPFKVPLLPPSYPGTLNSLPELRPHVDFHGQPEFANVHNSLDGPLKIQLLNPLPAYWHWQGQGSLAPASTFGASNSFRKRNVLHRRTFSAGRLKRRYSSSQATTAIHRL
ncbi:uncharacterized protein LOC105188729 [Harpegnathos saltator]|uniref:uncharacterized protein LOC105188729 n=1 Tax=Harpegnathos saltator TaxID=610380 RepID=UPI000DBED64D|nr:uncharacterized protein LOC105188729 [Harpegnathos saltator]XP_025156577.1 uncharacterized protein LOC105188729 [Harpegnathos saltator]